MQPRNYWNIENVEKEDQKERQLTNILKDFYDILNNGFIFQDNLRGTVLTVRFTAANTQQSVRHGLAFIPRNYIPINKTAAMDIYNGTTPFDRNNIYLRSSAIGTVTLLVF